ncbi:MAG: nucleoside 2-deoxyribosyltransferase [Sulfurimonas sp.]|nr:nucleoside 2-deoxyribosyltransferase [Sulfurimonas sp.]
MKKIYIAGPDVFERNSLEIGAKYLHLCEKYGFSGNYPLDNVIDFDQEKHKVARDIFLANEKLIDDCDIVIANLNAFRGKEADSGTIWECGYAYAKGKRVYGYMQDTKAYIENFGKSEKKEDAGFYWDSEERFIEDFDHPINLMITCSTVEIVKGGFEDVLKTISENKI